MKMLRLFFLAFLSSFVLGCASCVPGICGCALSVWPANWEGAIDAPAFISDVVGLLGMAICAIVMLVLWTKRKTREHTAGSRN